MTRGFRWNALGMVALALAGSACVGVDAPELLDLRAIGPDRVAQGESLLVEGEGFPLGRHGTLALDGECQSPGEPRRHVALQLPVRARTASEAVATVDRAFVARTQLRASCRFAAEIRFDGPERSVVGRSDGHALDVVPTGRDRIVGRLGDGDRARQAAEHLGIGFADALPEDGGLVVASVREGGVGARVGLLVGDTIVGLDGVRMLELSDFIPMPGFNRTTLDVRGADGHPRTLVAATFVAAERESSHTLGHALVAFFTLAMLAFFGPAARFVTFLASRPPRDPEATLGWLFGATTRLASRRARARELLVMLLGILGMSAAFGGIALIGRYLQNDFGIGILLSASLALRMAARVFGEADTEPAPYLPFFLASAPLTVVVAAIGLIVGTGHLGELHAVQGVAPVRWLVFANPVAFALFPVFAATALTRVEPDGTESGLAKVAARAHLMLVSALGAALFLGGWSSPVAAEWPGIILFGLKSWALLGLGLWARSMSKSVGAEAWTWTVPVAVFGLVAAALYSYVDIPRFVARGSGYVLSALAALVLGYVLVARLRAERDEAVLHPFL